MNNSKELIINLLCVYNPRKEYEQRNITSIKTFSNA